MPERPQLAEALLRARTLSSRLGYQIVTGFDLDTTRTAFHGAARAFLFASVCHDLLVPMTDA